MATTESTQRLPGIEAPTMCAAFQETVALCPDRVALRTPGDAFSMTWAEYGERVRNVAAGLASLGVGRGDTVGLMLTNRPEFHWCDTGAMHLGATAFSIYNTSSPEQIEYLLGDAANRVLITEQAFVERVRAANVPTLEHLIVVDTPSPSARGTGADGGDMTLEQLESAGADGFDFEAAWRAVEPDDVLTLIYTSGTTGPPKGVQLTHANMMYEVRAFDDIEHTTEPGERVASYLPMAHIAERGFSHYHALPRGHTVTSVADPTQILPALQDIRPTWFVGVPRIWEKMKAGLEAAMAAQPDEAKKQATQWAFDVGRRKVRAEQAGEPVPDDLAAEYAKADELVFSTIRGMLGLNDLKLAFTGAAPIPAEVMEFFFAMGIPILEVWGMSETSAVVTYNPPERPRIGYVGVPLGGAEVRLAEDGEVLVRGPMNMLGYRNQPEKTRETIDEDGWLHTGDVGEIDDGYLKIVDRKKELIINAAGKNMSPANIEAHVKSSSPLIGQAVAIGDGRPYNVALITLDPDGAAGRSADDPDVQREIAEAVERANAKLSRVEQIKKFKVLPQEWQPGGDELTPTMKLKRKPIAEKYREEIEALYG